MAELENYTDYRQFLKDYYDQTKARFPSFSYRYFCRKTGINSPSFYKSVVEGRRNLTNKTMPLFIHALGLDEKRAEFFKSLVNFNQSKKPEQKQFYLDQMRSQLSRFKGEVLPVSHYEYYTKWYYIAIRELACIIDWKGNYSLLAKSLTPPIKRREAREAVDLLLRLGMIKKGPDGSYYQSTRHIISSPEINSVAAREANTQFGKLAIDAIKNFDPVKRDISSLTMGLSEESFEQVKQEISLFKDRLKNIVAGQKQPEAVFQINIQLFPLSSSGFSGRQDHEKN